MPRPLKAIVESWRLAFAFSTSLAALGLILGTWLFTELGDEQDAHSGFVRTGQIQTCRIADEPLTTAVIQLTQHQNERIRQDVKLARQAADVLQTAPQAISAQRQLLRSNQKIIDRLAGFPACEDRYPPLP